MTARELRTDRQTVTVDGKWLGLIALLLGVYLLGWAMSSDSAPIVSSSAIDHPPVVETYYAAQLAALTPSPTSYIDPTWTATARVVIATATTAATDLPWCSSVELGQACALPGDVVAPRVTATLVSCAEIEPTPAAYTRHCRLVDVAGANGRTETR